MLVKQHNIDAYNSVMSAFAQYNKVCSVCPTGSGKSYQALQLIRDNMDKRILYVTSLVSVKNRFKELAKKEIDYTDFDCEIYSNLSKRDLESYKADIIILDEFHRVGAETYQRSVDSLLNSNPDAKVFGITATPIRYLDGMRDMSEELFDKKAFNMSLPEAIEKEILPVPTYVSCIVDATEIVDEVEKLSSSPSPTKKKDERAKALVRKAKRLIAGAPEIEDVLSRHIKKDDGKYVVFCPNISAIDEAVINSKHWFSRINYKISTYQIHSNLEKDADDVLEAFLSDKTDSLKLLFCVDMLSEGVHADGIDGVIFMRATTSPIVFYQQMGRAFSSGGKSPLIIDMVNNMACLNFAENFREVLAESIAKRHDNEGAQHSVEPHIYDYTLGLNECLQKLRACNITTTDEWLDACKEYIAEYGNLLVPMRYICPNGLPLGSWIVTKRIEKRKGKLNPDIEKELNDIGMEWNASGKHPIEEWLAACSRYHKKHDNLRVPPGYVTKDGLSLGNWIDKQRQKKKKGSINPEVEKALSDMGMEWNASNKKPITIYIDACAQYYEEHGDVDISQSYVTPNGVLLGKWLNKQRQKRKKGMLDKEIEQALENFGVKWDPKRDSQDKWIKACKRYYSKYGDLNVPRSHITSDNMRLGEWINTQRQAKKKGKINPEVEKALSNMSIIWVPRSKRAERRTNEN